MSAVQSYVPAYSHGVPGEQPYWDCSTWYYPSRQNSEVAYLSQRNPYGHMWAPNDQTWAPNGYLPYWPYGSQVSQAPFDAPENGSLPAPMVAPGCPVPQQVVAHQPMAPVNYAPVYVAPPPAPQPAHYYTFNEMQRFQGDQAVCAPQPPQGPMALAPGAALAMAPAQAPVEPALEYDIHRMAEFLSNMAYGVMSNRRPIWSATQQESFEKFVFMTLSSTRLSKSTVILALVYLSKRWSLGDLPGDKDVHRFYVLFVVSLVLANKVHDDNTFTNASWRQATGIAASEITFFEMEWLSKMSWSLQLANSESEGWHKWLECWTVFSGEQQQLPTPSVSPQASNGEPTEPTWPVSLPSAAVVAF